MTNDHNRFPSFRWEHPHKKRYYCASISKDLFGDIVVIRAWGGINKASGRITRIACVSYAEGVKLIEQIAKLRLRHGYILRGQRQLA